MPFATVNGTRLFYEDHGSGPAIVFAHGRGGNHLSWWRQVSEFQAETPMHYVRPERLGTLRRASRNRRIQARLPRTWSACWITLGLRAPFWSRSRWVASRRWVWLSTTRNGWPDWC